MIDRYRVSIRAAPLFALAPLLAASGCGHGPSGPPDRCVLIAFDDGKPEGTIAFPDLHYESIVRFELPPGPHKLRRLWLAAGGEGSIRWAVYETTPLDSPGDAIREGTRDIGTGDASNGRDARWLLIDLSDLPPQEGVVWVGVKKVGGQPGVWASRGDRGAYFVRSTDPKAPLDLLPVKRNPLLRVELDP